MVGQFDGGDTKTKRSKEREREKGNAENCARRSVAKVAAAAAVAKEF